MTNEMSANPEALAQQVMDATNNLTDEEATQRYQMIMAQLPSDQAAELNKLALSQVDTNERHQLASGFKQAHQDPNSAFDGYHYASTEQAASPANLNQMSVQAAQQDPNILDRILGNNSALGGKIGKAALAALAAILIRRLMTSQSSGANQRSSGLSPDVIISVLSTILGSSTGSSSYGGNDPLGGLLGGLLGGASGSSGGYTQQPSQTSAGGIDIGGLLGGLLGGVSGGSSSGSYTQQPSQTPAGGNSSGGDYTQQPSQTSAGGIDIGGLLGGLLGGASGSNSSSGSDLGSILSSILGGGSSTTSAPTTPTPAEPGAGSHVKKGVKISG